MQDAQSQCVQDVAVVHTCGVQVQDLAMLHTQAYASSTAEGYISKLRAAGRQPGALLSGSARNRLVTLLPGTSSAATPAIVYEGNVLCVLAIARTDVLTACAAGAGGTRAEAAFKAYDSCSLSLVSLVEELVQCSSPAAFSNAFLQTLPAWVDAVSVLSSPQDASCCCCYWSRGTCIEQLSCTLLELGGFTIKLMC